MSIKTKDPLVAKLLIDEAKRQSSTINLIASENYTPKEVLEVLGSVFTNKYAEGYPGKRYYPGNTIVDKLEQLAITRACKLFGAEHANVQALSGGPANLIIYQALLKPGDTIMSLKLSHGGHLSHGPNVNISGQSYKIVFYEIDPVTGQLNMKKIAKLAKDCHPQLIIAGFSAYSRAIDWPAFGKIAKSVKAKLLADISHTGGLIAGQALPSPFPYADVVMTTTHKSLRGPRGAIILCKHALANAIDKATFPGFQGGPHMNNIAGIAVALQIASGRKFKTYAKNCIKNAKALSEGLQKFNYKIISDGTDTHLLVIDLAESGWSGKEAEERLEKVGITVSRSTIPNDMRSPLNPSGIRLGTLAMTTRGLTPAGAKQIAGVIAATLNKKSNLTVIKKQVAKFCLKYPIK